jgi:hypothetical protein
VDTVVGGLLVDMVVGGLLVDTVVGGLLHFGSSSKTVFKNSVMSMQNSVFVSNILNITC